MGITDSERGMRATLQGELFLPSHLSPGFSVGQTGIAPDRAIYLQMAWHPQEESLTLPGGTVHPWLPVGQFLLVLVTAVPPKPCSAQEGLQELLLPAQGCLSASQS